MQFERKTVSLKSVYGIQGLSSVVCDCERYPIHYTTLLVYMKTLVC